MPDGLDLRALLYERERRIERRECEGSLLSFFVRCWREIDPAPFELNWHHVAICNELESLARGEFRDYILNIPPRCGKALDCDTPILTTWGWKRHGDLRVGDFIFGPDGTPKRVTLVKVPFVEESYEVKFDDGAVIIAGAGHLWQVERDKSYAGAKWQRVRKPIVVETTQLCVFQPGNHKTEVRPDAIPLAEPIQFPPKRLLIDPYVLGVWLGDGSTTSASIHVGHDDIEHFSALGRVGGEYAARRESCQPTYRVVIEGLETRLRVLGVLGNKRIPEDYLEAGIDQRWELLRGLMDTDGTAIKGSGACSYTTKLEGLAAQIMTLAASLSLKPTCVTKHKKLNGKVHGPYHSINFTPPSRAVVFRLARKQARLDAAPPRNVRARKRYVQSVTPIGPRLVNCIGVEGALYLAGDRFVATHNTNLVSVAFPAWLWCQEPGRYRLMGPHARFLCVSYGASLAEVAAVKMRRLVMGPWYQSHWGDRVKIMADQAGRADFGNSAGGERISNSIEGGILGRGGDIQVIDDPHKVRGAESDTEREGTLTAMREGLPTRITDPRISARVLVMQRLHAEDATNYALESWRAPRHTMLPMQYDPDRPSPCGNDIREDDGELLWPSVWTEEAVEAESSELGVYGTAGQLQQAPIPRGGGIIKGEWWRLWESEDFPEFGTCIAALDTAYKTHEEADYNAFTVWCAFDGPEDGKPKVMLRDAWRIRTTLSVLVERVVKSCREHKVDTLLIEDASRGVDVQSEIYRLCGRREINVVMIPATKDKASRLNATEPLFSGGIIYAPDREWAQNVIDEVSIFPRGRHDDYVDSTSYALNYLRKTGVATRREEFDADQLIKRRFKKQPQPVYDV